MFRYLISFIFLLLLASCKAPTLFSEVKESGITFTNKLNETAAENILSYEYFYNGGGVAAGDFNNDGLIDLYFSGNQVENKLYQNIGDFKFKDISQSAGVQGRKGCWKTGVSVVDINADGFLDIYVCYSGLRPDSLRRNQFFISNGINPKTKKLSFTDRASEMGLADSGYSTQATFFDYDLDGDLDCFLINHNIAGYQRKEAHVMRSSYDYNAADKLFKNNGNLKFSDVSASAGIKGNPLGFGLGISISDINKDGYPDIYVTNDYVEDDYLYINQKNSTFQDKLSDFIPHTSYSSMGVDIADINNDTLQDIVTMDMLPEDNSRQKLLIWPDNWNAYQSQLQNGFWHQNMRNMLQLNEGNGHFAEIGQLAGVSNTDWSWSVLLSDFDLDGFKDMFVSNGLGKDLTNVDFIKYYDEHQAKQLPLNEYLKQMTSSQTKNYIFKNSGNLTFENKQKEWGFDNFSIANGSIAVDLDNDGDLEIVTNNLNETSKIFRNNLQETNPQYFVKVRLVGEGENLFGMGSVITMHSKNSVQSQEVSSAHGFQSSFVSDILFGGVDKNTEIEVIWPSGKKEKLKCKLNSTNEFYEKNAKFTKPLTTNSSLFSNVENGLNYTQEIAKINNFERAILLPTQYSMFGPKTAVGDLDKDGHDDLVICGTASKVGQVYLNRSTKFILSQNNFDLKNNQNVKLADFNKDGFLDIYFVNGCFENANFEGQNDEIWLNDRKGNFKDKWLLTDELNSQTVNILDIDKDGDLDVFVGGYIKPNKYPFSEESCVMINVGNGIFKNQSLGKLGLISASVVVNNSDIVIVGEWMAPTLLQNINGKLIVNKEPLIDKGEGWWNSIEKGDLDGDGDEDLVLGNIGQNTQFKANSSEPAQITFDDFDQNQNLDFFITYYIQGKSYPAYSRDEVTEQIPLLRKKFTTYQSYCNATLNDFFEPNLLEKAQKRSITEINTIILENLGKTFKVKSLPIQAQFAPVYAILLVDVNRDKKLDLILGGNNQNFRLRMGKVSANYGQLFMNKGNMNFTYVPQNVSGFNVTGDVRSINNIENNIIFGVNNQKLSTFKMR